MFKYCIEKTVNGYKYTILDEQNRIVETVDGYKSKKYCKDEALYFCEEREKEKALNN